MTDYNFDQARQARAEYIVHWCYEHLPLDLKREVTERCMRSGVFTATSRIEGDDMIFELGGMDIATVPLDVLDDDGLLEDLSVVWVPEAPDDASELED